MKYLFLVFFLAPATLVAQPNCNYFKYVGDTLQYEACLLMEESGKHYQFTREAVELYDQAMEKCPYHAEAFYEKAVVYLKAGNFLKWAEYMDRAVELKPTEFLGIRASCNGKFFADFESAIADIDRLDALLDYDIGHIHDGSYHLDAYKALAYKCLGQFEKSIEVFETHISTRPEMIGDYDLIHLGVAYLEKGDYERALKTLQKQIEINDQAETQYYLALTHKALNNSAQYLAALNSSYDYHRKDIRMIDGFMTMEDQVFLKQIEDEILIAEGKR